MIEVECPECHGTGYIFNGEPDMMDEDNYDECDWCYGRGVTYDEVQEL
jgi:DnaJ-class molecular chaperone